jgi:hypothetical protein
MFIFISVDFQEHGYYPVFTFIPMKSMDSGIYPWKKLFTARHSLTIKFSIWARRRTKLASPWYLTTGWVLPDGNIKTSRSCSYYGSSTHQERVKWYRNFLSPQALSLIVYEP